MQVHKYNTIIPLEIGDIIEAKGYINRYEIIDILTIYSAKNKQVDTILKLKDIDIDNTSMWNYSDYQWQIIITNTNRKEVIDE